MRCSCVVQYFPEARLLGAGEISFDTLSYLTKQLIVIIGCINSLTVRHKANWYPHSVYPDQIPLRAEFVLRHHSVQWIGTNQEVFEKCGQYGEGPHSRVMKKYLRVLCLFAGEGKIQISK